MLYVRNVWICEEIEHPELHKFYGKLCTLYVRNVWIWRKIDCPELRKFNGNCVHYTYEMSRFAEKLNVKTAEIQREIVYRIYVQNVWICKRNWISRTLKIQREIVYNNCIHYICKEWLDLQKNWMSRTAEIQREILYVTCTECLNLQKNWISRALKIQREIVYIIYVRHV